MGKVLRYDCSNESKDYRVRTDDCRPTTHARACALYGRMLTALDRGDEAEAAFEEAIQVSQKHGLWLLEMRALSDFKLCVLDKDGRGAEGARRLKQAMQKMKGPPAE